MIPRGLGYIGKPDRAHEHGIWVGAEPCWSEGQGVTRAAELAEAEPDHEYSDVASVKSPLLDSQSLKPSSPLPARS